MIIDLPRFLAAERPSWTELEKKLQLMEDQPDRKVSLEEATRLHFLYQKVSADLVRLTTFASEPDLQRYLESLVARAYGEIHGARARTPRWKPLRWFFVQFPLIFRRHWTAFVVSVLITLLGMAFGGFAVATDDEAKEALIPAAFSPLQGRPSDRVKREEEEAKYKSDVPHSSFAGELMTHNTRVCIRVMALGLTWGIGTILQLFQNGVLLGTIVVDYIRDGQTVFMLGWLMPHGVIEIPSILVAGQAGLVLAHALIGRGSRLSLSDRMRAVAGDLATLIGGVAVMLIWAGIIESFVSQYHQPVIPYSVKIAFGSVELALLIWFLSSGRGTSAPATPAPATA
ncbi:MAG TPA: stage II sporulation protein M [Chthoniobacteraceae bacterium]|jgi:uncharacterized membrane protein SpoIIM required for sporulation|nr:stage II sporulation protein M [Chthoniobacteraceae bacterium]